MKEKGGAERQGPATQALSGSPDLEARQEQNKVGIVRSSMKVRTQPASGPGSPPVSFVDRSAVRVRKAERPRYSRAPELPLDTQAVSALTFL